MDLLRRLLTGKMQSPLPQDTDLQDGQKASLANYMQKKKLPFIGEETMPFKGPKAQASGKGEKTRLRNVGMSKTPVPTPTLLPNAPENPYMELLMQYFPPEEVNNASNVMFRESGFRPDARGHNDGGTTDYGLFQINDYWQRYNLAKKGLTLEDLLDPETNIRYAAEMQAQQGWNPWYGADSLGLTSRSQR